MSPDERRRQAAVTDAAWRRFRAGPAMIEFLNGDHAGLGGRPLALSIASDAGLEAVLALLHSDGIANGVTLR